MAELNLTSSKVFKIFYSFLFVFLSSCANPGDYKPTTDNPKVIYEEACSWCHGSDFEGTVRGPSLVKNELEILRIRKMLVEGNEKMPRFKHLTGDTLESVINYVSKLK